VIRFFWGVDKVYEALGLHTLFLAGDYRENFEGIIRDLGLPANPSLYVHAPVWLDPSMAPRRHVFRRLRILGISDLEALLKFEVTYTPLS
jgi:phytoene dehydrogenase-like protein